MILPPEKSQCVLDTTDGDTEARPSSLSNLEHQPESASNSRAIVLSTFLPTPLENVPLPSYSNDFNEPANPAISPSSSCYAPALSTAVLTAIPVSMALGRPNISFSRVPSRTLMYPSFQPMFLVAIGKTLDKGFPYASPSSSSNPHPFVSHDVYEGDWISFLQEARTAAILTEKQIKRSRLPIVSLVPIVNSLSFYGVKEILKIRNAAKVINCIYKWNRHFFELRKLKVVLMKGQVQVSGQKEFNDTSTSRSPESENPPSSISQELVGKNDNILSFLFHNTTNLRHRLSFVPFMFDSIVTFSKNSHLSDIYLSNNSILLSKYQCNHTQDPDFEVDK